MLDAPPPCKFCREDEFGLTASGQALIAHLHPDCPGALVDQMLYGSFFFVKPNVA